MTVKEARRLTVGDKVLYKGELHGIVTSIKLNSAYFWWEGRRTALEVPHDQMCDIEREKRS